MGERFYPLSAAGREVGLSAGWLRKLCDRGTVKFERDASGRRLVPESEVRRLRGRMLKEGRRESRVQRPAGNGTQ